MMSVLAHMTHHEVPVLGIVLVVGIALGAGFVLAKVLGRKK